MKQTIEIEVPDGKKAILKDSKLVFEDITPQLPKTWQQFCTICNKTVDEFWINSCSELEKQEEDDIKRSIDYDRNLLPSKQAASQHLTLMQIHQLRDYYRQGWKPNWKNSHEEKCCIRNSSVGYGLIYSDKTPYFLSFQSYELASEFLNNFKDLIEQTGDLI